MALTDNIVAYYKLNVSETPQPDEVGTEDLTVTGATHTASGKISGAYDFDGTNDKMDGTTAFLDNQTDFSYSLWVNADTDGESPLSFANSAAHGVAFGSWTGVGGAATKISFMYYDGSWKTAQWTTAYSTGTWYHVVCTVDQTANEMKLYVDGTLRATTGSLLNPSQFLRGPSVGKGNNAFFDGKVDEIGIWSRELTSAEVTSLYNSGSGLTYPFTTGLNIQINISDAWKTVDGLQVNIGDVWKTVSGEQVNITDVWKTID